MLAKPQGFPRKLGGCAGLDPRLRSAVSAGVGDGERGLRRGLRAPGVGVRPKWVLEYSPSNKRIRYFVSITYVRTGLWTAHKFCGGGNFLTGKGSGPHCTVDHAPFTPPHHRFLIRGRRSNCMCNYSSVPELKTGLRGSMIEPRCLNECVRSRPSLAARGQAGP